MRPFRPPDAGLPRCGGCAAFDADGRSLKAALPGVGALGSVDASVRSDDGLCARHERWVSPRWSCAGFQPRLASRHG